MGTTTDDREQIAAGTCPRRSDAEIGEDIDREASVVQRACKRNSTQTRG
ncbi:hypothetical protein [Tomitella gaofuii]|nr:hypothetical protein [Tomitella gaofuii]